MIKESNSLLKACNSDSFCSSKSCAVLCPVKTLPDDWIVVVVFLSFPLVCFLKFQLMFRPFLMYKMFCSIL